jgi:hypothetical protein
MVVNPIVSFIQPAEVHRAKEHVPGSAGEGLEADRERRQDAVRGQQGVMVPLKDPRLRRFWFTIPSHWGIGVTAYTREEAEALARSAAQQLRWEFAPSHVAEDIDLRTLDQGHVIPNMRPPNFHGVWFPLM